MTYGQAQGTVDTGNNRVDEAANMKYEYNSIRRLRQKRPHKCRKNHGGSRGERS